MDQETINKIKSLREETGAPLGLIKEALESHQGDIDKAKNYLLSRGAEFLSKKEGIVAGKGIIEGYIHFNGKVGALIELRAETDFVTKSDEFKKLAHELALQIATMKAVYVSRDEIPTDVLARQTDVFKAELKDKPDEIVDKIVAGKLEKWFSEVCLLDQPYFKDEQFKIKDLISQAANKFKEKIEVRRFVRLSVDD
jgi:elongation factor Ts